MSRYSRVSEVGRRHAYLALHAIPMLTERDGYPPTVREVADEVGIRSIGQMHDVLCRLKDDAYVDWKPTFPRTLRLTERGRQALL